MENETRNDSAAAPMADAPLYVVCTRTGRLVFYATDQLACERVRRACRRPNDYTVRPARRA